MANLRLAYVTGLVLVSLPLTAADLTLLSQGNGTWREIHELSQIPANQPYTVLRVSVDGGPQPPPGDSSIRDKVAVFSKDCLKNQQEAKALSLVVRLFVRDDADLSKSKAALARAIDVLEGSSVQPQGRYRKWLTKLDEISPAVYTREFINSVDQGLSQAWNLQSGALKSGEIARLDPVNLINLIKLIFELLRDLGIFGGGNTSYLPSVFDESGSLLYAVTTGPLSDIQRWLK